jgi:hypothetical protein
MRRRRRAWTSAQGRKGRSIRRRSKVEGRGGERGRRRRRRRRMRRITKQKAQIIHKSHGPSASSPALHSFPPTQDI